MLKQILSATKVVLLALVLSFGLSYALAWTSPTATPPGANVAAPINAGSSSQEKLGGITAGSLTTTGLTNTGTLRVTGGAPGLSKVLTSDASGNATWQAAAGGSDNLGNHTATQDLNMAGNNISGALIVSASDVFSSVGGFWMSASKPHGKQRFTANGNFTVPAGVTTVWVTMSGGAGGGGGAGWNGFGTVFPGGRGGNGGTITAEARTVTPGAAYAVTRGAGGAGGAVFAAGGAGGASSFGSLISAAGGTGGTGGTGNSNGVNGTSGVQSGLGGSIYGVYGVGGAGGASVGASGTAGGAGFVLVEW